MRILVLFIALTLASCSGGQERARQKKEEAQAQARRDSILAELHESLDSIEAALETLAETGRALDSIFTPEARHYSPWYKEKKAALARAAEEAKWRAGLLRLEIAAREGGD